MYKIKSNPEDFVVEEINSFEKKDGKFIYFILTKKNYTTVRAIQHIARSLGVPAKFFGFAGNKDKVAVTKQLVSVHGVSEEKLNRVWLSDISIEIMGRCDKYLSLGELGGNKFEIVVRELDHEQIEKIRKKISGKIVVPNYFGEQRFSFNNHLVGKEIVKGNFKQAIELILENNCDTDKSIKEYLVGHANNYVGALRLIPKKILRIYVHAYQSYIWNFVVKNLVRKKIKLEQLAIVGFGSESYDESIDVLETEGVAPRDFIIRQIPELSAEGDVRDVCIEVTDFRIIEECEDFLKIGFTLPKGSYATVVVEELVG